MKRGIEEYKQFLQRRRAKDMAMLKEGMLDQETFNQWQQKHQTREQHLREFQSQESSHDESTTWVKQRNF